MSVLFVIILLFLGSWQLGRLQEKRNLMTTIEAQAERVPLILDAVSDFSRLSVLDYDYHPVTITGSYIHSDERFWFSQIVSPPRGILFDDRVGFHIITPFRLLSGRIILVDRGFVPRDSRDVALRPDGEVTISGLLHWPARRGWFDPPDEPSRNIWYVRDIASLAGFRSADVPRFLVERHRVIDDRDILRWPLGGQTHVWFSNRHLQYALTWYGLALALAIISLMWHIKRYGELSAIWDAGGRERRKDFD